LSGQNLGAFLTAIKDQKPAFLSRRFLNAVRPFLIRFILFAILGLATLLGALEPLNLSMMDMRFRILERPPSGTLVVVEIDPFSLKQEERWPWPRDRYATAIKNLQNAGATLIAFDVDFSSLSDEAGDAAFVDALSRNPGEVILPVFSQRSSHSNQAGPIVTTPPHPSFLKDAVVASVNLTTEKNGLVRRGWRGFYEDDTFRASIAATLAETPGARQETFYIDYGVDLSKIDRLSFSDVLNGNFPIKAVQGKKILIGATALELGDEFAAPIMGVTPGVMLHALSYESFAQHRTLQRPLVGISLFFAIVIIFKFCHRNKNQHWRMAAIRHAFLFAGSLGAPVILQAFAPISFDVGAMLVAQVFSIFYMVGVTLHRHAQQILSQRAATARYQALTNLVVRDNADGVIVADAEGLIELYNDRATELFDSKGSMLPGTNISDFAPGFPLYPSTIGAAQSSDTLSTYDPPIHSEYSVQNRNDLTLEVISSRSESNFCIGADDEGPSQHYVYTLRDISARKRIELAERAAKKTAIDANKFKSELISNMSHELRTPLNSVIGFADILQKESFGPLGVPDYKEYSENIYISGKRLLDLVNNMLNIAKLDAGEFGINKTITPIDELVEDVLNGIEHLTDQGTISITTDIQKGLPELDMDFRIFNEMLTHLLSNSIKYAGDDAHISIRVKQCDVDLVIEIEDNGCGVDPTLLPRLTEAFYQADGTLSRQHEGAGLGLYITTKLATLHNGTLEFESEEGVRFLARLRFVDMIGEKQRNAA
jgi:signal transduction histidine kinase/CHASE2 domain-containing sensor protein